MKNSLHIILVFTISFNCAPKPKESVAIAKPGNELDSITRKKIHLEFIAHFRLLDSASKATLDSEIYCCTKSAWFMEVQTRIESEGEKGYVGIMSWTKNDVKKWHQWYEKNKDSISYILPLY